MQSAKITKNKTKLINMEIMHNLRYLQIGKNWRIYIYIYTHCILLNITALFPNHFHKSLIIHTLVQGFGKLPVDVVLFNVRQWRAATVPGPRTFLGWTQRLQNIHQWVILTHWRKTRQDKICIADFFCLLTVKGWTSLCWLCSIQEILIR